MHTAGRRVLALGLILPLAGALVAGPVVPWDDASAPRPAWLGRLCGTAAPRCGPCTAEGGCATSPGPSAGCLGALKTPWAGYELGLEQAPSHTLLSEWPAGAPPSSSSLYGPVSPLDVGEGSWDFASLLGPDAPGAWPLEALSDPPSLSQRLRRDGSSAARAAAAASGEQTQDVLAVIPEPSGLVLAGLGGALAVLRRRRRRPQTL